MSESLAVERWIASTLSGDAVLQSFVADALGPRVFADIIPEGRGYPAVLFTCTADGNVVYAQPDFERLATFRYRIWVITDSADKAALAPIRDRVQVLLQGKTGAGVVFCRRVTAWNPPLTLVGDKVYARLGDEYAIWVAP